MGAIEALILGIIQGLTEFLPVSSSGHLELGAQLLGLETENNLLFAIAVHGATALSTLLVFRKEVLTLLKGIFKFKWNEETKYVLHIIISIIPVGIVGIFFEKEVEALFAGKVLLVASMLAITGLLLLLTNYAKSKEGDITTIKAVLIGVAQSIAILPGISRSGATISTALLLGVEKSKAARFSFLMVLPPIMGALLLKVVDFLEQPIANGSNDLTPMMLGFVTAFISGFISCKWMINLVKKGKLIYFAIYCFIVSIIAIIITII